MSRGDGDGDGLRGSRHWEPENSSHPKATQDTLVYIYINYEHNIEMYYSTILCKALWNIYYIFLRNQDDNYMLSLTMTGLPFHTQIHRNWNFTLAFTFSFGISQSRFPLCLNLGEKAGSQNKAEGHLGQHPLSLLAMPGVPASLQAQLHSFHVSLIMHTPPFNYDASKSQNVCCQTDRMNSNFWYSL